MFRIDKISILAAKLAVLFSVLRIPVLVLFALLFFAENSRCQKTAGEFLNLGLNRYYEQDYENAILNYDKAVELKPDFASAYYFRAKAKEKMMLLKPAIEDLNLAVKYKPDFGEAYYQRGNLYEKMNKKTEACQDWNAASSHGYYEASYVVKQKCTAKKPKFDTDED